MGQFKVCRCRCRCRCREMGRFNWSLAVLSHFKDVNVDGKNGPAYV